MSLRSILYHLQKISIEIPYLAQQCVFQKTVVIFNLPSRNIKIYLYQISKQHMAHNIYCLIYYNQVFHFTRNISKHKAKFLRE